MLVLFRQTIVGIAQDIRVEERALSINYRRWVLVIGVVVLLLACLSSCLWLPRLVPGVWEPCFGPDCVPLPTPTQNLSNRCLHLPREHNALINRNA